MTEPAPITRSSVAFVVDFTSASVPDTIILDYSEATDTDIFASVGVSYTELARNTVLDFGGIRGFVASMG